MTKEELRILFMRYTVNTNIQTCQELLQGIIDCMAFSINNHHSDGLRSEVDGYAKVIYQMILTRALALKEMSNGTSLGPATILDPTIIAGLVRNLFETCSMFHLIYCSTQNENEKQILHKMWMIAGLQYRQRFETDIITKEIKEKHEFEKSEIERLKNEIEESVLFQQLDAKDKEKIRTRIKSREYLIKFDGLKVKFIAWHDMIKIMGISNKNFSNIYTYFSLYAHPSYVSVMQFGKMFNDNNFYLENSRFNLQYSIYCLSIFIADFINVFPTYRETFEKQPLVFQVVINFYNQSLRGKEYIINSAMDTLN